MQPILTTEQLQTLIRERQKGGLSCTIDAICAATGSSRDRVVVARRAVAAAKSMDTVTETIEAIAVEPMPPLLQQRLDALISGIVDVMARVRDDERSSCSVLLNNCRRAAQMQDAARVMEIEAEHAESYEMAKALDRADDVAALRVQECLELRARVDEQAQSLTAANNRAERAEQDATLSAARLATAQADADELRARAEEHVSQRRQDGERHEVLRHAFVANVDELARLRGDLASRSERIALLERSTADMLKAQTALLDRVQSTTSTPPAPTKPSRKRATTRAARP